MILSCASINSIILSKILFGHGGKDPGACGDGIQEKDIVLSVGKEIKKILSEYECSLKFTRESDIYLSLTERVNISNNFGADIFISIHVNSSTNISARGIETFCYKKSTNNNVANTIHNSLLENKKLYYSDRGVKEGNFTVIAKTLAKACLIELAFISNSDDCKLLKSYIKEYANQIAKGIIKHQNLKKKVNNERILYQVNTGAYANRTNAENQMRQLEKDGYKPYITIIKDTI